MIWKLIPQQMLPSEHLQPLSKNGIATSEGICLRPCFSSLFSALWGKKRAVNFLQFLFLLPTLIQVKVKLAFIGDLFPTLPLNCLPK